MAESLKASSAAAAPPVPATSRWAPVLAAVQTAVALALVVPLVPAPWLGPVAATLVAAGALVGALMWRLARQIEAAAQDSRAQAQRLNELVDALPMGIVAYDADDRIVYFNRSFATLYEPLADAFAIGKSFAELLHAGVTRGLVPEAKGREQAWIDERLWSHRDASYGSLREMADGRWRRISEHRTGNGGIVAYSIDVTELVRRERSVESLRHDAELARTRLRDAIEALPAGFELYDAQDRLILSNATMRSMYPHIGHLLDKSLTFEQLVRANRAAGGLPQLQDGFEDWLSTRLQQRRRPGAPTLFERPGGQWVRVYERRTSEGGLVGVRVDVSDVIRDQHELAQLRAALAQTLDAASTQECCATPAGLHLTADLSGCQGVAEMTDAQALRQACLAAVVAAGLRQVGELFHRFPGPGGVTGVVLLAESHLAVHTWPEDDSVTLDVFVCNRSADNGERAGALIAALERLFGAAHCTHHRIERQAT